MVFLRLGREGVTKIIGTPDRATMIYYEDTVWSTRREAEARQRKLNDSTHFTTISEKRYTNAPDEFIVWVSTSMRKGTKFAKKRAERDTKKEDREAETKPKFRRSTKFKRLPERDGK